MLSVASASWPVKLLVAFSFSFIFYYFLSRCLHCGICLLPFQLIFAFMPRNWSKIGGKVSLLLDGFAGHLHNMDDHGARMMTLTSHSQNKQVVIGSTFVYSSLVYDYKQHRHEKPKASQNGQVIKNLYQTLRWSDNFNDVSLFPVVCALSCC